MTTFIQPLLEIGDAVFGAYWPAVSLTVWTLLKIVAIVLPLMGAVAYLTLAERKVIGYMQVRIGRIVSVTLDCFSRWLTASSF